MRERQRDTERETQRGTEKEERGSKRLDTEVVLPCLIFARGASIKNVKELKSQQEKHEKVVGVHFGGCNLLTI